MRAFIAIELPAAVQDQVHRQQRWLEDCFRQQQIANPFRWTAAEQVHLTLRFLGEIDHVLVPTLAHGLHQVAAQAARFELVLGELGCFPNLRTPRILWIGLQGDLTTLGQLQIDVDQVATASGLPTDRRSFSPHLTIARARRTASPRELAHSGSMLQALTVQPGVTPISFTADEIVLMQSELLRDRPRYTPIGRFRLGAVEGPPG